MIHILQDAFYIVSKYSNILSNNAIYYYSCDLTIQDNMFWHVKTILWKSTSTVKKLKCNNVILI